MKKLLKIYLFSILMVFWAAGIASAIQLGTNITTWDGVGSGDGWWGAQEDEEVEPGCVANQSWDLEGFFLDGTTLTMVGGYDFETGNGGMFEAGDIFIDTGGTSDYEYALRLDFLDPNKLQYTVYHITNPSYMLPVYYSQNIASTPWKYDNIAAGDSSIGTFGFTYDTGLDDDEVANLQGGDGTHNAVAIDLCNLIALGANLDDFTVHFTMECGNDNLMGSGSTPVPEPATVMLVGTGLLGMIAFGRKRFNKKA